MLGTREKRIVLCWSPTYRLPVIGYTWVTAAHPPTTGTCADAPAGPIDPTWICNSPDSEDLRGGIPLTRTYPQGSMA
ncbi:hypothetical protein GCM10009555_049800 [Acrocarpospora macrocephala]|uniref:Uncharacterized protein n=1 Tax=Acrocarpospora macrocephala TaxID=150177 RepID=A0A5M3WYC4_9ACTN|nr:hypothetical protein Amac_064960 [Acrocarpospora macrocephala]